MIQFVRDFVDAGKTEDEKIFRVITLALGGVGIVLTAGLAFAGLEAIGILFCILSTGWTTLAFVMLENFRNFAGFSKLWGVLAGCYALGLLPFGSGASTITISIFIFIWVTIFVYITIIGSCARVQKKKE